MAKGENFTIHCQNCSFSHLCLPVSLNKTEIESLDDIIERNKPIQKGQVLTSIGQPFQTLYAVRSGSLKSSVCSSDGEEQIIGFHLPGDIIGFDGLNKEFYQSQTVALETTMVCEIPFNMLEEISGTLPKLRRHMMRILSNEISQDHELMMLLNKRNAEQRLAYFLANLSERFGERGFSSKQFRLSMTRGDIGNYLGLTIETISRLFSRFQQENIIQVEGKFITISDEAELHNRLN